MDRLGLPLQGIRVVDFSQAALGPVCTRILADLGADVIKVEPIEGDFTRLTSEPMVDSVTFIVCNLNKRSLSVNVKDEKGLGVIKKLISTTDVVVQNFRPGVMKRLGLDYETLCQTNPRLVYASLYMYGEAGPLAHRRGGDMWAQAFTGMIASQGSPEGPPYMVGHSVIDYAGASVSALGVMVALFARERTGRGQEVTNSLVNTAVLLQWPAIAHYLMEGVLFKKIGRGIARSHFPYGAYPTADGDVVTIFGQDDSEWPTVCVILGIEHLLGDPRYDTAEKRDERKFELYPILDEAFRKRTRAEWAEEFRAHRLRADPCLDYAEFVGHPQFAANKLAVKVRDPRDGEVLLPSGPLRFSGFPIPEECEHAPVLGEHSEDILRELGYREDEIRELADQAVIATPTPEMFTTKRQVKGPAVTPMYKGAHEKR